MDAATIQERSLLAWVQYFTDSCQKLHNQMDISMYHHQQSHLVYTATVKQLSVMIGRFLLALDLVVDTLLFFKNENSRSRRSKIALANMCRELY